MIREIKNVHKPIKYLVSTNLRDIIVLVREKSGMEWKDKLKMKFRVVDEYNRITTENAVNAYVEKTIIENGEEIILFTPEDYDLENMLDLVNSKFKGERLIEEFINSTLKDAKTIEFIDDKEENSDEDSEDILNMS